SRSRIARAEAAAEQPYGSPFLSDGEGARSQNQAHSTGGRGQCGRLAQRRSPRRRGDAKDAAGAYCEPGGRRDRIARAAPAYSVDAGIVALARRFPRARSQSSAAPPCAGWKVTASPRPTPPRRAERSGVAPLSVASAAISSAQDALSSSAITASMMRSRTRWERWGAVSALNFLITVSASSWPREKPGG